MRDIAPDVERWIAAGERVAIATVLETWGSAPRSAGSKLAVSSGGGTAGSVSGGCVEGAVIEIARRVLATGKPEPVRFGVADETAWSVGLACGGSIEVLVDAPRPELLVRWLDAARAGRSIACVSRLDGEAGACALIEETGTVGEVPGALRSEAEAAARAGFVDGRSRRIAAVPEGGAGAFVDVVAAPPTLVIVGAVHIAVALEPMGRALGYRTIVVDPRAVFANVERFPGAHRIVSDWPDEALSSLGLSPSSAVVVLTHDPKLDDPALLVALRSPAFYVGALGSKKTQEKRRARLLSSGISEGEADRLHAPVGLDLGGRSPEEIALSVMAQIVAVRNGRSGRA